MLTIVTNETNVRFQLRALNVLSVLPGATLKPHREIFVKTVQVQDEYVPEVANYILLQIDGTYKPEASTMGPVRPGAARPGATRTTFGDPQV